MGLAGWGTNNKLSLTIDSSKIDQDLIDFPVLITLSADSGQSSFDATGVFTVLTTASGSYVNRKKIAVSTDVLGTETQLYVEIESWDDTTTSGAYLWTKVPTISSGTDTILYLYCDSQHADNTAYVGDTGDAVAQNVWNDYYMGVWHLAQDPNGDVSYCILDSTVSGNNGTPEGTMITEDLIDAKIGKGIAFDGSDDAIGIDTDDSLNVGTEDFTLELIFKTGATTDSILAKGGVSGQSKKGYKIEVLSNQVGIYHYDGSVYQSHVSGYNDSAWHHFCVTHDRSGNALLYFDSIEKASVSISAMGDIDNPYSLFIGKQDNGANILADIDEVRISKTILSPSWVKATYYSNWDGLLTYSGAGLVFTFTNPIPVDLSTVYGTSHALYLTTTIDDGYTYDATFYDSSNDIQIGSTVSGVDSGQPASVVMQTPSGVDYGWYMSATSSGESANSSSYSFTNRFLCSGTTSIDTVLTSGVQVRLYRRDTGALVESTVSEAEGKFTIITSYEGEHFAVAFADVNSLTPI